MFKNNRTKYLLPGLLLPLLFSCSNIERDDSAKLAKSTVKNNNGYRCEKVASVGSHLKKKNCTTKAQREQAKREAEKFKDVLRNSRQNNTTPVDGR